MTADERRQALSDYIEENPYAEARVQFAGHSHRGHLLPRQSDGYEGTVARIRDPKKRGGQQYMSVFDKHLTESYPRLEVKTDTGRYKHIREVLGL